MSETQLLPAGSLPTSELCRFLSRVYHRPKAEFLAAHGAWWHRGQENRWAILVDGQLAAYCGVVPTSILVRGTRERALWWIDLVVAPEFRGRGLQSLFDQEIRRVAGLKLGFPNQLAAAIHRKHGWGVRDDLAVLMLPLRPLAVPSVRRAAGSRGIGLRLGALLLAPWAAARRERLRHHTPGVARRVDIAEADLMARVFDAYRDAHTATTYRDAAHVSWRYLQAPYRSELAFYVAGPQASPTHFAVARHLQREQGTVTRLLDIFGDWRDTKGLRDIIMLAAKDAVLTGSTQVTALATLPELQSALRSAGFIIRAQSRFCWNPASEEISAAFSGRGHWVLADSDNDVPDETTEISS